MVFCNSCNSGSITEKTFSHLEANDLQGFPNKMNKSEILDLVYAKRSFENINRRNIEKWL
jgi:hypothetical protein